MASDHGGQSFLGFLYHLHQLTATASLNPIVVTIQHKLAKTDGTSRYMVLSSSTEHFSMRRQILFRFKVVHRNCGGMYLSEYKR